MADANLNALITATTMLGDGGTLNLDTISLNSTPSVVTISIPPSPNQGINDNANFLARYIALDSSSAQEDGSDLAYMRILQFNNGTFGKQVFPITSANIPYKYQDFIVTDLQGGMTEKAQIIKTNNTLQVYSFDSQVEILNIQGVLKSTIQNNWDMAMIVLWDNMLRLTKLIQMRLICEFGYQNNVYWGLPLNFQWRKSSSSQYFATYSMQFVVVKRTLLAKNVNQLTLANDLARQIALAASGS